MWLSIVQGLFLNKELNYALQYIKRKPIDISIRINDINTLLRAIEMTKSLTILFQVVDGIGHVNSCIGVAEVLRESGHRIVFAINDQWRGKLSAYGFEEELISDPERDQNQDPAKYWTERVNAMNMLMELSVTEKLDFTLNNLFIQFIEKAKNTEDALFDEIVNRCKPDVIIVDNFFVCPSLIKTGIPWVFLCSANPLFILNNEELPPPGFGLSINSEKNEWKVYRLKLIEIMKNLHNSYNEWLNEYGLKKIPESSIFYTSPYLTIYDYPKEIDYSNYVLLPPNIHGFDNFMRSEKTEEEFLLPDVLRNKSGKLVYLSLGSMGSGNVKLMKRLVSICSKSAHRFIVSKGQTHDQYELADNMWGEKTVPQTKVLPLVDLVITHGGNNTLTEAFYFGKPMIVLPLMADQFDNAQRLEDSGYGKRLDTFNCSETELLDAIETLLNDSELKLKLEKISERIQTMKSLNKVVELVEELVK